MPLKQDLLKEIKEDTGATAFFETGLNAGESFLRALGLGFEKLIGVEINNHWIYRMYCMLKPLCDLNQVNLLCCDSAVLEADLVDKLLENKQTIFFLDAHLDSGLDSALDMPVATCPLEYELKMIAQLSRDDHILLIDDLRILTDTRYGAWQTDDFEIRAEKFPIEKIMELVHAINPNYKTSRVTGDDRFPNDVLYCRVP